uniref:Uncharacterized protein n=1 Tax=Anguilla anguilla TaxID=7936 RepID=A0A0E9VQ08_ANGAN
MLSAGIQIASTQHLVK